MTDSPLCTFCKHEIESFEHLFLNCSVTRTFWEAVCLWLRECNFKHPSFTLTDIFFGVFNVEEDFIILNHVILIAKFCIYKCKLTSVNPSLRVYKAKIRETFYVEKKIAARQNKLTTHFQK